MERIRPSLHAFGSLWFGAVMLVLLLFAMASATVFESTHGTEQALALFYYSWWFFGLLGIFAASSVAALIARYPYGKRELGFLFTHGALVLILAGSLVTKYVGERGQVAITEGETATEWRVEGSELLTLRGPEGQVSTDIATAISKHFEPTDLSSPPALTLGPVSVEAVRYLPDSRFQRRILDDAPMPQPAVEVRLVARGHEHQELVTPDRPATLGSLSVSYRQVGSAEELARIIEGAGVASAESKGQVRITLKEEVFEFPVEQGLEKAMPLGGSGLTARVLRYLPHAAVETGGVVNRSERPVNPYVEVEIAGADLKETRKAFAKFPDFGAMHGASEIEDLKVALVASAADPAQAPIEVIQGPGGKLLLRLDPGRGREVQVVETAVGRDEEIPWPEHRLRIDAVYARARATWTLEPITPIRKQRMPGVILRVKQGESIEELALQKYRQEPLRIPGTRCEVTWRNETRPLGFGIKLDRFHLGRYPGTGRPRSFESHVTVTEPATGRTQSTVISMNNPGKFGDYTLYQSSYQMGQGPTYTVLSVSDDPGQLIVFLGYFVLMGGMIIVLAIRMADRRRIARAQMLAEVALDTDPGAPGPKRGGAPMALLLLAGMLVSAGVAWGQDPPLVPDKLDMETLRALPCQHDGRWPPLDTVARDVVLEVTGETFFQEQDPVAVLLAWTFEPEKWQTAPLIPIRNAELRGEIGLPADQTVFSLSELIDHPMLRPMMDAAVKIEGRKPDPLESKVLDIREKLIQLQRIFGNQVIRPIPHPSDMLGTWLPTPMPGQEVSPALEPFRNAWNALRAAFLSEDSAAFSAGSNELLAAARALPAAHRPASKLIAAELRYNESNPLRGAWILMAIATALAGVGMVIRRRAFDALVVLVLVAAFAWLSYGLSLRWQFAGRIPASNMFESLLFLGWGVSGFAIIAWFVLKHRLVLLTAAAMGALSLCLADVLPIDKFVRPIAPVLLDTVWMSIHVPIIMVSYAVLAIAVLIAHVQIVGMAVDPRDRDLTDSVDSFHYWFVHVGSILLTIGIITGSMWAASSWGRYWGWDPKEVWSLAALFGYMAVIHVRADKMTAIPPWLKWLAALVGTATLAVILPYLAPFSAMKVLALAGAVAGIVAMVALRGPFATALKSILCFWLIIMTYVGVNYVLGTGLHSYGFGTGAMVRYLYLIGGIDLALLGGCAALYYARRPRQPSAVLDAPVPTQP